jgi:hypothetical protein
VQLVSCRANVVCGVLWRMCQQRVQKQMLACWWVPGMALYQQCNTLLTCAQCCCRRALTPLPGSSCGTTATGMASKPGPFNTPSRNHWHRTALQRPMQLLAVQASSSQALGGCLQPLTSLGQQLLSIAHGLHTWSLRKQCLSGHSSSYAQQQLVARSRSARFC